MAKAELKTKLTGASVREFLAKVTPAPKRKDCETIAKLMKQATGAPAKMWGSSIVGFGSYHYKYESGREADWFLVGFSPRAKNITVYLMSGLASHTNLLMQLGKYKTGSSCLYISGLDAIDVSTLKQMIAASVAIVRKRNA